MSTDTPYSAIKIANTLVRIAKASNGAQKRHLTPMKLLKLVYVAHGFHLAHFNKPLIAGPVSAWKYGPVVESVYYAFKHHGSSPITEEVEDYSEAPELPPETMDFLRSIFSVYGDFSGPTLSNWTHRPGSAWSKANGKGVSMILEEEIKTEFIEILDRNKSKTEGA